MNQSKIVIFICLDCFPDKLTISEIDTCIAKVIKRATDRKDGGGSKKGTPSTLLFDDNRK